MKTTGLITIFSCFLTFAFTQYHVNMNWVQQAANPIALNWSSSITNSSNELIHVSDSLVPNEGANLIVTKYDRSGSLLWQSNFNSQNTNGDFGIKATTDSQGKMESI